MEDAIAMVEEASTDEAVRLFEQMATDRAIDMMDRLEPALAGPIFEGMATGRAVNIMTDMDPAKASAIMDEMSTGKAVEMIGAMPLSKSAEIWSGMEPPNAGAVFDQVPSAWTTAVVKAVPEDRLIARLPEATALKLWEIPLQVLIDNLPSVPVMHLDFWNRPKVDPDLQPAKGEERSPTVSVYTLPQARESEWALLVGSPLPFERLWAKFNRPLPDVKIILESLNQRPNGTPALPTGRIANTFLGINLENAEPGDIAVAAAIISVEKSWISANSVHKWSIQFSRFDEALNAWVPFPTKRIREDAERVSFALVVPAFSIIAITGSEGLPEQVFSVTDLSIRPESPVAGDDITISASVTNTGPQEAVYPANLWLNHSIEATQTVAVGPGRTAPFSFTVSIPEGAYEVRLERLLGKFTVRPAAPAATPAPQPEAVPPAVGGPSPSTVVLAALSLVATSLFLGGTYLLVWKTG